MVTFNGDAQKCDTVCDVLSGGGLKKFLCGFYSSGNYSQGSCLVSQAGSKEPGNFSCRVNDIFSSLPSTVV